MGYLSASENWNGLGASMDGMASLLGLAQDEEIGEPLPAAGEDELTGQEIADKLEAEVFNDANYEGNGDYLIPASLLCPDIEVFDEADPTGFGTEVDQECLDLVSGIEPRIHAEAVGTGLDFTLLIGPQKAAPLTLELREDSLAIAADLAEAKLAAEHIASVSGEDFEPQTMEGVAAAKLTVHGPEDVSVSFSIRERIAIEATLPGSGPIAFSSEAALPLFDLRINGAAQELGAILALGRTQFSAPYSTFDEESTLDGLLAVDWQGLSASMLLSDNSGGGNAINNIGFGDGQSTVKLNDVTLFSLDLNADAGRHFSLNMIPGVGGALPSFYFDPGLDLDVGIDLSPMADAGDDIPSYLLGETYSFEVESGAQLVETSDDDRVMAVDGAIRITSRAPAPGTSKSRRASASYPPKSSRASTSYSVPLKRAPAYSPSSLGTGTGTGT